MATASKTKTVTVKTDEKNPEPLELIARSIIEVAAAFKKIEDSKLNQRVIVLLLSDMLKSRGIGINQIEAILWAAPRLESHYLKQLPKGGK